MQFPANPDFFLFPADNKERIIALGGVKVLLAAMENHEQSTHVMNPAIKLLWSLAEPILAEASDAIMTIGDTIPFDSNATNRYWVAAVQGRQNESFLKPVDT